MSFNNRELHLITDPCLGPNPGAGRHTFTFNRARGGAPLLRFASDSYDEHIIELADGSRRMYRTGNKPLRNIEIQIGRMDRYDVQLYRQWRAFGDIFALFANYSADTCIVTHFEDCLASEVGSTAEYVNAAGAAQTGGYENGLIGRALLVDYNAGSPRRIRYDHTLTGKGSISLWNKISASPPAGPLGLFSSTVAANAFGVYQDSTSIWLQVGTALFGTVYARPAAGTWHHLSVDWSSHASAGTCNLYYDGSLLQARTGLAFPTFNRYWYAGMYLAGPYDSSASSFDEIRFDQCVQWDATEVLAQYDRATQPDELALAENLQGHRRNRFAMAFRRARSSVVLRCP